MCPGSTELGSIWINRAVYHLVVARFVAVARSRSRDAWGEGIRLSVRVRKNYCGNILKQVPKKNIYLSTSTSLLL